MIPITKSNKNNRSEFFFINLINIAVSENIKKWNASITFDIYVETTGIIFQMLMS